jgi:hypothetical protein
LQHAVVKEKAAIVEKARWFDRMAGHRRGRGRRRTRVGNLGIEAQTSGGLTVRFLPEVRASRRREFAEEGFLADHELTLLVKLRRHDDVRDAGFILDAHENQVLRRAGTLATDHHAADHDPFASPRGFQIGCAPEVRHFLAMHKVGAARKAGMVLEASRPTSSKIIPHIFDDSQAADDILAQMCENRRRLMGPKGCLKHRTGLPMREIIAYGASKGVRLLPNFR